jgi:hypothetical protein
MKLALGKHFEGHEAVENPSGLGRNPGFQTLS